MRLRQVVVPAIATTLALAGCSGGSESTGSSGSEAAATSEGAAAGSKSPEASNESPSAPKESEAAPSSSAAEKPAPTESSSPAAGPKAAKAPDGPATQDDLVAMAKTLGCPMAVFQKSGGDSAAGKAGAIGGVTCQATKENGYILALLKEGQKPDQLAKSLGTMAKQTGPLPKLHSDNWVLFAPKGLTTTKPTFDKADLEGAKKKLGKGTIS